MGRRQTGNYAQTGFEEIGRTWRSANARLLPNRFLAREGFTLVSDRGIVRIEGEHGSFC
jgi:hypothetical protein